MNTLQLLRQIKHRLQAQSWDSEPVWADDSVVISAAPVAEVILSKRPPYAILSPGSSTSDDEDDGIVTQRLKVAIVHVSSSDGIGEAALIGSNAVSLTDSRGRGLLALEEMLYEALRSLTDKDGIRVVQRSASAGDAALLDEGSSYAVRRDYEFEAVVATAPYFAPPARFAGTDATGGDCALSWSVPADRFDRDSVILRRAAGSTAPASPTDGTGVALSGDLATSVTDSPGAGTFSYSIFGAYDEDGDGAADRWSDAESVTVVVT